MVLTSMPQLLQHARNGSNRELLTLCGTLDEALPKIRERIGLEEEVAFQCRRAATEIVAECKRYAFDAVRLAGYIPRFRGKLMVILLCEPDWASLEAALRDSYSWWAPNQ